MKTYRCRPGRLFYCLISALVLLTLPMQGQEVRKTIVADTLYRADGSPARGALQISWPALVSADGKPVAAGTLSVKVGPSGTVNVPLVPTEGALPAGAAYKVVVSLDDGTSSTEYWAVPLLSPTTIAAIRSTQVPATVAMQVVSREYVDAQLATAIRRNGDEAIDGVKQFVQSPLVPSPGADAAAANKGYVDVAIAAAAPSASNVLNINKGGTGTSSFTPARCVRVAEDGNSLEAAGADCGNGDADTVDGKHASELDSTLQGKPVDMPTAAGQQPSYNGSRFLMQDKIEVDARDCGLTGDGVTDDSVALNACIAAHRGQSIVLAKRRPHGSGTPDYFFASDVVVTGTGTRLAGVGEQGFCGSMSCSVMLKFARGKGLKVGTANDCAGCGVDHLSLIGSAPFGSSGVVQASQCILPSVDGKGQAIGVGNTNTDNSDGVEVNSNLVTLRDLFISGFGRYGVRCNGNSGTGQYCDFMRAYNVVSYGNRGSGWFDSGSDANNIATYSYLGYLNQLYGMESYSFLGSTHVSPGAHTNHSDASEAGPTSAISSISTNGSTVTMTTGTAVSSVDVGNVIVVAGTSNYNGSYFVASKNGNTITFAKSGALAAESLGTARLASCGETWALAGAEGGGYKATGGAVTSVWIAPYAEADNGGPSKFNPSTHIVIGGDIGAAMDWVNNPAPWLTTTVSGLRLTAPVYAADVKDAAGNESNWVMKFAQGWAQHQANNSLMMWWKRGAGATPRYALEWREYVDPMTGSSWIGARTNSTSDSSACSNYAILIGYGDTTEGPTTRFCNGFYMGSADGNVQQRFWHATAAPATPSSGYKRGDLIWNTLPTNGSALGWVCVSGTTSCSTWAAFGPIGMDTTGTGAPSGSCTTGSSYRRTDGGLGTTFYVCEGGSWRAK